MNAILWEVQTLREDLVLALAERVKTERVIREVVREPRNRGGVLGYGPAPRYTDPASAVEALRKLSRLAYLVYPGRKNRIKPEVLLGRYQDGAAAVQDLITRLEALEEGARQAGINLGVLPGEY